MTITSLSSRDFNQDASKAKKAAKRGPVFITNRGRPAHVLLAFAGRVLALDTAVVQRCARLHVPDRRADRDALIAATALVHGMTVATRNVADFEATGAALFNPWVT